MKHRLSKTFTLFLVIFVIALACIPLATLKTEAAAPSYLTTGLEALYLGTNNTGSGHNANATTWADLSGKGNNITGIATDAKNHFTDNAFLNNSLKVYFPDAVKNVIAGQAFTVEIVFGAYTSLGTSYNTVMNSTSDNFALFRRNTGDFIEFKSGNPDRPKVAGGEEYFRNSTITITFKVGGNNTLYVDGVQIDQKSAANAIVPGDSFWFGHDDVGKNFEAEYIAMRFYSVELTAAQVATNRQQDLVLLAGGSDVSEVSDEPDVSGTPDTSTASSANESTPASESAANNTSSTASTTSNNTSGTASENVKTGDTDVIILDLIAVIAAVGFGFFILKRKSVRA